VTDHPIPFRPPLSDEARRLLELALEPMKARHPMPDFSDALELSIELELIADALRRCAWIQTGKKAPFMEFRHLSPELQQRYRYLAERAIATIDPAVRLRFQAEAAEETEDWVNGPGETDNKPSIKQIAEYALGAYECRLSGVRIDMERGE
jgi:hypothetical protein